MYLWLILLVLSFVLPAVIQTTARHVSTSKEPELSAPDFSDLAGAELKVRTAFGTDEMRKSVTSLASVSPTTAATGQASLQQSDKQRLQMLAEAVTTLRSLEQRLGAAGVVRQILVVDHARRQPLDEMLVDRNLAADLADRKTAATDILREQRFWRAIYGPRPFVSAADLPGDERLVDGLNLRFLKDLVLTDLYRAAGDRRRTDVAAAAFDAAILRGFIVEITSDVATVLIALAGLWALVVFAWAAWTRQWQNVARVATQPQALGWGDLLDAFLFYMVAYRGLGLAVDSAAVRLLHDPTETQSLVFTVGCSLASDAIALVYLIGTVRRRGVTLADLGLRAPRGVLNEIGYGCVAYCGSLPILVGLGLLTHLLFRHDETRTPNPAITMIAFDHDPIHRAVIFLLASVAAPFFEELFFRGVLFSALRTRWSWVPCAAVSGLVFAMLHPMQDWIPIFGLGFVLATVREMRQSLVAGMTIHFLQNTLVFISLSLIFGS
jgi:membrane protease YdiL (CAAX protease family)